MKLPVYIEALLQTKQFLATVQYQNGVLDRCLVVSVEDVRKMLEEALSGQAQEVKPRREAHYCSMASSILKHWIDDE